MSKVTETNFKATLMDVMKSTTSLQNDIQRLITFAITYCASTGNTLYLTMLRREVEKRKGLSVSKLDGYIRHMIPVVWGEAKDGKEVYKKAGELEVNAEPEFTKWVDFHKGDKVPSKKTLARLIKSLESYASPGEGIEVEAEARDLAMTALALLDKEAA